MVLRIKGPRRRGFLAGLSLLVLVLAAPAAQARVLPLPVTNLVDGAFQDARAVHAADVDQDGDTDILGAAVNGAEIAWWDNVDGSGTNWAKRSIDPAFASASSVYGVDLDQDGDMDVLGAAPGVTDLVSWWENTDGDGTNWVEHGIDGNFNGRWAIPADIDGDGDPDVVGAAPGSFPVDVTWWENLGGATNWAEHLIDDNFDDANQVHTADMDRDGDVDVLGAAENSNAISWWENVDGDGLAWIEHPVETNFIEAASVFAVDVDGDGDLDILGAADSPGNEVSWWENSDGTATNWSKHVVDPSLSGAQQVLGVDFDLDGDTDILGAASLANDIVWWENVNGDGSVWSKTLIDGSLSSARAVFAADIDGDGDLDAMGAGAFSGGRITWYDNRTIHRNASFRTAVSITPEINGALALSSADVDGDGDVDLVSGAAGSRVEWHENLDGVGTSWGTTVITFLASSPQSVYAADLDGDGAKDVVVAEAGSDVISFYRNTGTEGESWQRHLVFSGAVSVSSVVASDLDRDGDADVVAASSGDDTVRWIENADGVGSNWTEHLISTTADGAMAVYVADVNGDGAPDVLSAAAGNDTVTAYGNVDGSGIAWTTNIISGSAVSVHDVTAADIDGDGALDVATISSGLGGDSRVTWHFNAGGAGTIWGTSVVSTNVLFGRSIRAGDMDQDGDVDLVSASYGDNRVMYYENVNGDGTAWAEQVVSTNATSAEAVLLADVDGDSDVDIVSASAGESEVVFHPNTGGQFDLVSTNLAPSTLMQGMTTTVLAVTAVHLGRPEDTDIELDAFEILLEENPGDTLGTGQTTGMLRRLDLYLDDGSGLYESTGDTLVTSIDSFLVAPDGRQSMPLNDGDPLVTLSNGFPKTYFLVVDLTPSAGNYIPNQFILTFLTSPNLLTISRAEDNIFDLPLSLAFREQVASALLQITAFTDINVEKTAMPATILTSNTIVYALTVTNTAENLAADVVITDVLPTNVVFDALNSNNRCTENNGIVTCTVRDLPSGVGTTMVVTVQVKTNAVGILTNTATVATAGIDTNLLNNESSAETDVPDTDGDGNPNFGDPDDDGDLMLDFWEVANGLNPTNAADAEGNLDVDEFSNLEEFIADTDPNDSNSFFRADGITTVPSVLFESTEERFYTLQFSDDSGGTWSNVPGRVHVQGASSGDDALDDPDGSQLRYYRLRVELP